MCVIFFYANSNPLPGGYKLILASNRDEFYHRDTRNASKWLHTNPDGQQYVYGGVDLEPGREGGTWLAIGGHNGVFKVGALLNLTGEPKPQNAVGRGMLVSDFVTSMDECSIDTYNEALLSDCRKYSAFNFVSLEIGDRSQPASIKLCSNVPPTLVDYAEGKCYGFGNSLPAQPFEKVRYGQQRFEEIVDEFHAKRSSAMEQPKAALEEELVGNLKSLLKCNKKFWPDEELMRRAPNWGEHMSSLNVNVPDQGYGSRTHTIILVDGNDKMHFIEDTMATLDPSGEWVQTHIEEQYFANA